MKLIFVNPPQIAADERDATYWKRNAYLSPQGLVVAEQMRARLGQVTFGFVAYPGTLNYAYQTAAAIVKNDAPFPFNAATRSELDPFKSGDELDSLGSEARNWTTLELNKQVPGYLQQKGYEIAAALIFWTRSRSGAGLIVLPEPYLTMGLWALSGRKEFPPQARTLPGHGIRLELFAKSNVCYVNPVEFGPVSTEQL